MRRIILRLSALIVLTFLLSSCVSLGPAFQKVETIPAGVGLVYLYRPRRAIGSAVAYDIKTNGTVVTTLYNGGYYPYLARPGEVEFWAQTESKSAVTLDVQAGETYYIKGTVGVRFFCWTASPDCRHPRYRTTGSRRMQVDTGEKGQKYPVTPSAIVADAIFRK